MADVIDPGEYNKEHKKRPHRHSKGEEEGHWPKEHDYQKRDKLSEQHAEQDVKDHFDSKPETTKTTKISKASEVGPVQSEPEPKIKKGTEEKDTLPTRTMPEPGRFKPQGGKHGKPWTGS